MTVPIKITKDKQKINERNYEDFEEKYKEVMRTTTE